MLNKTIELNKKKDRLLTGFTAIEAIIAIFVLTVGVIGIYSSFSRMAISTSILSSRLIASYLAKEGIEVIRNIRDTNWLKNPTDPTKWNIGLTDCSSGCEADYKTGTPEEETPLRSYTASCGEGCYLNIVTEPDGITKFYSYTSGTATKFKRKITITPFIPPGATESDGLIVSVEVKWEEKGKPYDFTATEEYLYNWY